MKYHRKGKKIIFIEKQESLFKEFTDNESILHDVIEHLMANPTNARLQNVCEKIHIKILSSNKNYKCIIEILEEIANDEFAELCSLNVASYDENVENELKSNIVNKLCYYYLGEYESGNYFEKFQTLNSFLDNKKQEYYIWQHKASSCEDCKKLSKHIYTIDTIPNRPHPNCKCAIFSVSDILLNNPNYMALSLTQSKSDPKSFESALDNLQFVLDMVGLVQGFGEIADVTNALIYLARKDYKNAALSLAMAIPVAGIFFAGGKITAKVVKVVSKSDDAVDVVKRVKKVTKSANAIEGAGKTVEFKGKNVTKNNKLFDPNKVDEVGRTNIQRMEQGLAPKGYDGKPVNIHHIDQTNTGPVTEISGSTHQQNNSILHQNTGQSPSQINRPEFNKWRSDYWKGRANDFK